MAKVALVSAPFQKDYMRNARCDFVSLSHSSWFPIWLGQAGAYLESLGHQTWLYDAQVEGRSFNEALEALVVYKPDLVALYTGRLSEDSDIRFGDLLEAKGIRVVYVGPYASIDPENLLKKSQRVSLAIQREFELPLQELLESSDIRGNPNFVVKLEDGSVRSNPLRPLYKTETLDRFPLTSPYFHRQLDVRRYKVPSELYPFLDVMSGRGCAWGKCNFCLWVQTFVAGSNYNLRSIDHFLGEFEYVERYMPSVRGIMIQDDMLTNTRATQIAEGLLARNFSRRWSCYVKPNSKLSLDTLKVMRRSGCLNLHVGFESGDEEVLKKIDKGSTVEQAKELGRMAREAGLFLHADFAMGHFGESDASMERTIELAHAIAPHTAQFQLMIPFKGTKFWQQLEESNSLGENNEPSYERMGGASAQEIRKKAKHAYRSFYLSSHYLKTAFSDPKNYLFNRFDQYRKAIPALFWRDWIR